eukprot:6811963-Alexandrium_andersonii.AAC.1
MVSHCTAHVRTAAADTQQSKQHATRGEARAVIAGARAATQAGTEQGVRGARARAGVSQRH